MGGLRISWDTTWASRAVRNNPKAAHVRNKDVAPANLRRRDLDGGGWGLLSGELLACDLLRYLLGKTGWIGMQA